MADASLYAGVMSGTSLDGVDVALVAFGGEGERPETARLVGFRTSSYDETFRDRLRRACGPSSAEEICLLSFELGERFARTVLETLDALEVPPSRIRAVGSHGQTLWHAPGGGTLQIGEGAVIAERTGIPVVEDFRVRDLAAGGQGAPLTAYFDRLLLGSPGRARGIQNLGGMGNLTALPREGDAATPVAFDTGPGVVLLDAAVRLRTAGRHAYDPDGAIAARGQVCRPALDEWLADPFFRMPPPRSTGRERFGESRLRAWLERHADLASEDVLATLTELTARSIALAVQDLPYPLEELFLCGGGRHNRTLRRRIERAVAPCRVAGLEELGWDPDAREAAAFALLARQHLLDLPIDLGWATGAAGPRRLGKLVPA